LTTAANAKREELIGRGWADTPPALAVGAADVNALAPSSPYARRPGPGTAVGGVQTVSEYRFNLPVTEEQLAAIGMVAAEWSYLEV